MFGQCCLSHISGGYVDYKRKNFWHPKPERKIVFLDDENMEVNGEEINIKQWLETNEHLWLEEWEKWRKSIALCSKGDFHWTENSPVIAYRFCHMEEGMLH